MDFASNRAIRAASSPAAWRARIAFNGEVAGGGDVPGPIGNDAGGRAALAALNQSGAPAATGFLEEDPAAVRITRRRRQQFGLKGREVGAVLGRTPEAVVPQPVGDLDRLALTSGPEARVVWC